MMFVPAADRADAGHGAIQNLRMVSEMAKTRKLAVLPKLAVEFHRVGPSATLVALGLGPVPRRARAGGVRYGMRGGATEPGDLSRPARARK